jgi:hypothetical protein
MKTLICGIFLSVAFALSACGGDAYVGGTGTANAGHGFVGDISPKISVPINPR